MNDKTPANKLGIKLLLEIRPYYNNTSVLNTINVSMCLPGHSKLRLTALHKVLSLPFKKWIVVCDWGGLLVVGVGKTCKLYIMNVCVYDKSVSTESGHSLLRVSDTTNMMRQCMHRSQTIHHWRMETSLGSVDSGRAVATICIHISRSSTYE